MKDGFKTFSILSKLMKEDVGICNRVEDLINKIENSLLPGEISNKNLILLSLKNNVPQDLLKIDLFSRPMAERMGKYYIIKNLVNKFSIDKDAAKWVVEGWWKTLWSLSDGYFCPYTGMEFSFVKGKFFQMGNIFGNGKKDELPVHEVKVSDFYIARYLVTQQEWLSIMDRNPSFCTGDKMPVENVSWEDSNEFIYKLNKVTGSNFRLPTEAEWECAARSGGKNEMFSGSRLASDVAVYNNATNMDVSVYESVGTKRPNGILCYDMSGNLIEWCNDFYNEDYYSVCPKENPKGPLHGRLYVARGGSFVSEEKDVTCFSRFHRLSDGYCVYHFNGGMKDHTIGFRLAFTPEFVENTTASEVYNLAHFRVEDFVVNDLKNGLMWIRDASIFKFPMKRMDALDILSNFEYAGFKDWRLPSLNEFNSLNDYHGSNNNNLQRVGFQGNIELNYWTADVQIKKIMYGQDTNVYFSYTMCYQATDSYRKGSSWEKDDFKFHIWPVRNCRPK